MFGLNSASLIGRLGGDVRVSQLESGGRVANLDGATNPAGAANPRRGRNWRRREIRGNLPA